MGLCDKATLLALLGTEVAAAGVVATVREVAELPVATGVAADVVLAAVTLLVAAVSGVLVVEFPPAAGESGLFAAGEDGVEATGVAVVEVALGSGVVVVGVGVGVSVRMEAERETETGPNVTLSAVGESVTIAAAVVLEDELLFVAVVLPEVVLAVFVAAGVVIDWTVTARLGVIGKLMLCCSCKDGIVMV